MMLYCCTVLVFSTFVLLFSGQLTPDIIILSKSHHRLIVIALKQIYVSYLLGKWNDFLLKILQYKLEKSIYVSSLRESWRDVRRVTV